MIFCDNAMYADETIRHCATVYRHTPTVVSTDSSSMYKNGALFYTMPGRWSLKSLANTRRIWNSTVVCLRGDVLYNDATLAVLFSRYNFKQATFYYQNGELVCFSAPRDMLKKAIEQLMDEEYVDENDWRGLFNIMKSLWRGSVNSVNVDGNTIATEGK